MADSTCACGAPLVCCIACFFKKQAGNLAKTYGPMVMAMVVPKIQAYLDSLPVTEGGTKK